MKKWATRMMVQSEQGNSALEKLYRIKTLTLNAKHTETFWNQNCCVYNISVFYASFNSISHPSGENKKQEVTLYLTMKSNFRSKCQNLNFMNVSVEHTSFLVSQCIQQIISRGILLSYGFCWWIVCCSFFISPSLKGFYVYSVTLSIICFVVILLNQGFLLLIFNNASCVARFESSFFILPVSLPLVSCLLHLEGLYGCNTYTAVL